MWVYKEFYNLSRNLENDVHNKMRQEIPSNTVPPIFCKNTYVTLICLSQITFTQIKYYPLLFLPIYEYFITFYNLQSSLKSRSKMQEMRPPYNWTPLQFLAPSALGRPTSHTGPGTGNYLPRIFVARSVLVKYRTSVFLHFSI